MTRNFQRIDAVLGKFHEFMGNLVGIVIAGFVVAISVDLFLRSFGLGTLAGVQELIEYALFAGVFLTAPWLLRLGAHVRVDLILGMVKGRKLILIERIIDAFGFIICLVMAWFSWINLSNSWIFNAVQQKVFNIPEWWLLGVVLTSFILLAIEFMFRFFRAEQIRDELDDPGRGV